MNRRHFLRGGVMSTLGFTLAAAGGCRGDQTAQVVKPGQPSMVGSHAAGAETYTPLVDETVTALLARHSQGIQPAGFTEGAQQGAPLRICFMGVDNRSQEEIGDFREHLFEQIDGRIVHSQVYQSVSRKYVEAGLRECRLRPDELLIPQNMRMFTQTMERNGQPIDYLLYATLTSGTTRSNKDYQRSYLLTLELLNVRTGQADKEQREIQKRYNASTAAKVRGWFG